MRLLGLKLIIKLKKKNTGNHKLLLEVDRLLSDLKNFNPSLKTIKEVRDDADCVHSDGFYFFNIHVHRTLVLIELDDEGEATIIWVGTHQEYERIFKNNKKTIEKWLRHNKYID